MEVGEGGKAASSLSFRYFGGFFCFFVLQASRFGLFEVNLSMEWKNT